MSTHEADVLDAAVGILRKYHDDTAASQEAAEFCEVFADEIRRVTA